MRKSLLLLVLMTSLFSSKPKESYVSPYGSPFGGPMSEEARSRLRTDIIRYFMHRREDVADYERRAGAGPNLKERAAEIAYQEFLQGK